MNANVVRNKLQKEWVKKRKRLKAIAIVEPMQVMHGYRRIHSNKGSIIDILCAFVKREVIIENNWVRKTKDCRNHTS